MKSWSLNTKLYAVFTAMVIASLITSWFGISRLRALNHELGGIVEVNVPRVRVANQLRDVLRQIAVEERNYMIEKNEADQAVTGRLMEEKKAELDAKIEHAFEIASDKGRQMYSHFRSAAEQYWKTTQLVREHADRGNLNDAFHVSVLEGKKARLEAVQVIQDIIDFNQKVLDEDEVKANQVYTGARNLMILLAVASALGAGLLVFFLLRTLGRSIDHVIDTLSTASEQVAQSSEQIAQASEQLSQSSNEQAASLQETSSSLEELTSMVSKNTESAKSAAENAQESLSSAESGKGTVQTMVGAIQELEQSNQQIAQIVKVFNEIREKTQVIEDIVFQTQLLSFNASVEAARAGEHGKGFAVVAEEVGNLAEMSGNASSEITQLLSNSLTQVETTVEEIRSKIGRLVEQGGSGLKALETIVAGAESASAKVNEIAVASAEQSRGIQEINRAMGQLDQATQQNAATSEEAASSAEELSGQAVALRQTVQELIEVVKGSAALEIQRAARAARREVSA